VAAVLAQGVIVYFRVVDGQLRAGDVVKLMNTGKEYQVDEVGVLAPKQVPVRATPPLLMPPLLYPPPPRYSAPCNAVHTAEAGHQA
jgi:hypothetical protein